MIIHFIYIAQFYNNGVLIASNEAKLTKGKVMTTFVLTVVQMIPAVNFQLVDYLPLALTHAAGPTCLLYVLMSHVCEQCIDKKSKSFQAHSMVLAEL